MPGTGRKIALALLALWALRYLRRRFRCVSLKDKVVVITGGANGIGRDAAFKFARAGARVCIWDIDAAGLAKTKADIEAACSSGHTVLAQRVDMSKRSAIYAAAKEVQRSLGFVYCVVNNCGIVSGKFLLEESDTSVLRTFDVNALAVVWTTKAFLPAMLDRNSGHIVTVSSLASFFGSPKMVSYAASKFASRGLMSGLHQELIRLGATGVHTSCVCPGHVATNLFQGFKTLVPSLSVDTVAQSILDAVQKQDVLVILPWYTVFMVMLQHALPTGLIDFLNKLTGVSSAMDKFTPGAALKNVFTLMDDDARGDGPVPEQ